MLEGPTRCWISPGRSTTRLGHIASTLALSAIALGGFGGRWSMNETPASLERRLLIADPQSVQPGGGMLTNLKVGIVMTVLGGAAMVAAIAVGIIF